ncbi:MAG: cupredoxin family copper-binding protein [Acidiphilium sp.]|nr:cupredoxin family copper-binding protein [Acidiphilium sp.]MDD4935865.1 cupredoxin family copper-binding protein [Acidiphilium sp.]
MKNFKSLRLAVSLAAAFGASPALAATQTVTINDYTFSPATLTVHPGDRVTWTNRDSVPHTATALDGKTFDSGTIDPGSNWSFTFSKAGDYNYRCAIHPEMRGSVAVR